MTPPDAGWKFEVEVDTSLPALAWVARVTDGQVHAVCGDSVQVGDAAIFEGTWAGPKELGSLPDRPTIFGSGLIARESELVAVTPSHHLEGVHSAALGDGSVVVSNSLAGAMTGSRLEPDPDVDYPSLFAAGTDRWKLIEDENAIPMQVSGASQRIPVIGGSLTTHYFENVMIDAEGRAGLLRKPREAPFTSFDDYRTSLLAATESLVANAAPYEPVVSLSSGYDSTAVAVVVAAVGGRRAVGFQSSRPARHDGTVADSGQKTAELLGLSYREFDRLAYLSADDTPEAEFISTGMVGEEILFKGVERELLNTTLFTGYWAGAQWAMSHSDDWEHIAPSTTAGASFNEFRLRADFIHVPLPVFGAVHRRGERSLLDLPEMDPYRLGGHYDRPIPRRLAEEAGVPRGSFGVLKRAANVLLQHDGMDAFTPSTRQAVLEFARQHGTGIEVRSRPQLSKAERGAIKAATALRMPRLVRGIERRRASLTHFEPQLGTMLFRWAIDAMRPRYAATEKLWR